MRFEDEISKLRKTKFDIIESIDKFNEKLPFYSKKVEINEKGFEKFKHLTDKDLTSRFILKID